MPTINSTIASGLASANATGSHGRAPLNYGGSP
jgi:hypothetical protein